MHSSISRWSLIWAPALLALVVGCGPQVDSRFAPRYDVTGTISLQGQPLESGHIQFTSPEDVAEGSESFAEIINGVYRTEVTEGKKQVIIRSPKPVGKPDETGYQSVVDRVPAKYNDATTLEVEVTPQSHTFDFELKK